MKYTLPNKTTGYAPEVVSLLQNLREESLCYEKHFLMHPLDVFSSVFGEVVDSGIRLTRDLSEAQRLFESGEDISDLDSQIRNGIFNFIFCLSNFLDGCKSIIKSLSSDQAYASKANREFTKNIRSYDDYVRKMVNYIKHRHRAIRTIYGKWERNIIVGYFVEGVVKKGSIGPDPDIHKDSSCAISLNRDISYHLINTYAVSASLSTIVKNYGVFMQSESTNQKRKDENVIEFIKLVSNIPRKFFPDEIQMDWPEVKIKHNSTTQFELMIPSKRKPENHKSHPMTISYTFKVRSRSRSVVLPYFRAKV